MTQVTPPSADAASWVADPAAGLDRSTRTTGSGMCLKRDLRASRHARNTRRVTVTASLPLQGSTVVLREAVADDVPAIVELLVQDELGASRDGITNTAALQPYLRV